MNKWQQILITIVVVVFALILQREYLTDVSFEDNYKEKYERTQDSLRLERNRYQAQINSYKFIVETLNDTLDSLSQRLAQLDKDYKGLRERLENLTDAEVVEEFDERTVVEGDTSDSIIITINQVRNSLFLFYERDRFEGENLVLRQQVNTYSDLKWTYQEMAELYKQSNENLELSLNESNTYIGNLQTTVAVQNSRIDRLERCNKILIGSTIAAGVAILLIAL